MHNIKLPDPVLAYRVLKSSNITAEKEQLARATLSELTYSNIQSQLRRIFDEIITSKSTDSIKVEPIYQAWQDDNFTYYNTRGRRNININNNNGKFQQFKRQEYPNKWNPHKLNSSKKTNPLNLHGKPTKCHICDSIFIGLICVHDATLIRIMITLIRIMITIFVLVHMSIVTQKVKR